MLAKLGMFSQRHVGCGHHRRQAAVGAVSAGRQVFRLLVDRLPLLGACRAFHQLILIVEQHVPETRVPLDRRRRPGAFEAAGDRMIGDSAFVPALPAEALLGDVRPFGLGTDLR